MRSTRAAVFALALASCASPSAVLDSDSPTWRADPPDAVLRRVRILLEERRFDRAAAVAEQALAASPDPRRREGLLFAAAEARAGRGDALVALEWIERLMDDYPATAFHAVLPERLDRLGRALAAHPPQRIAPLPPDLGPAIRAYSRLVVHYPDHPAAARAWLALSRLHRRRGEYDLAARALDRLAALPPPPALAAEVCFERARVALARWRGPDYDPTPLDEAAEALTEYLRCFGEGAPRAAEARLLLEHVREQRAVSRRLRRAFYTARAGVQPPR